MNELKVKYILGVFIIATHLLVILTIIYFRIIVNGFTPPEFTTLLGIVTPMFSGYTTAIIAFFINDRYRLNFDSKRVSIVYVFGTFAFPTLFASIIIISICLRAQSKSFNNFEDFKTFILSIESIFGVYVGTFIHSLFKRNSKPD